MVQMLDIVCKRVGTHIAVQCEFDIQTRLMILNFVFLSTTKSERDIENAICKAFDLLSYSDHCDKILPQNEVVLDWVSGRFEMAEEILNRQVLMVLPH